MGLIFFVLFFLFALTYWLYKFMRALWKTDSMTEAYKLIMLDLNNPTTTF
jgi:Na+-transporting methylmalonyl-CoA/oxaloacetate decarboxylase gamma subunit